MRISKRWQALNKNDAGSQEYPKASIVVQVAILMELLTTLVKLANGMAVDHCYSDIGCFPLSEEFYHPSHRPFNVRPWHRRRIDTRFLLFNRHHSDGFLLEPWDKLNLIASHFNPLLETKIIIPGWLDSLNRALWVKRLKDSLLWLWQPVNIIIVHWQNFTPYTIATANSRVVGAELANLLKSIETQRNYDRSYYHIIGHSLGAHIAGYCGDRLPGLGRITALDPARPFFQHMPKSVRLDRGDAKFVDAIHSDFTPENAIFLLMSYGMSTPVGHLDFYPNGHSYLQPGCLRDTLLSVQNGIKRGLEHSSLSLAFLEAIRYLTACDHQRSHEWFIESITNRHCTFVGVRCNEFEGLINGRCTCDDSPSACAIMGIHADQMYVHNLHEEIWPLGQRGSGRNRDPRNYHQLAAAGGGPVSPSPSPPPLLARPEMFLEQQLQVSPHQHQQVEEMLDDEKSTRNEIHDKLLYEAARLRKPPMPNPVLADELYVGLDHMEEDTAFINYLRAHLILQQRQHDHQNSVPIGDLFLQTAHNSGGGMSPLIRRQQQIPLPRPQSVPTVEEEEQEEEGEEEDEGGAKRRRRRIDAADTHFKDDVELIFSGNNAHPLNKHPKLMSDLDRDIENWYEDSSRWFLKTSNKPSYCVNQYQILIYLGPLRTSKVGQKHLRANLLVSVIGSRGKLMNQRFIPRSANLDSFTMQPFFVVLEGTYTLGSILSVAVGWEARTDPDPIQATISFQSSLLDNVQASLPAPPRLRPLLGETSKYDHSRGFRWRAPSKARIEKRSASSDDEKCLIENGETGQCTISHSDIMHEARSDEQARHMADLLLAENELQDALDNEKKHPNDNSPKILAGGVTGMSRGDEDELNYVNAELEEALAAEQALRDNLAAHYHRQYEASNQQLLLPMASEMAASQHQPPIEIFTRHTAADAVHHQKPYGWPITKPYVPMTHEEFLQEHENRATAKFHNLHHLLKDNNNIEDSIVINQIVVNPLQANYGKEMKPSKVFCPARPGQRLRRDQTIRLSPNLLGRCQVHHHHHHHNL